MTADEAMIAAAMRLRGAAPAAWEEFLAALRQIAARAAQDMVGASADMIFKAQGRALAHQEIVSRLISAPEVWAKMEAKLKDRHGPSTPAGNPGTPLQPGSGGYPPAG